jgi:hypothetical protein
MVGGAATAQEWNVGVGGFFNSFVGYTNVDNAPAGSDWDGISNYNNAEIIFAPSITLDNGMTFGANVQLEAFNGSNNIDESYMYIESDTMGKLVLGAENSAGYAAHQWLPGAVLPIYSPSISAFIPVTTAFRDAFASGATEVAGNNDVNRISYYTPSFNGLTVGVSYAAGQASSDFSGAANGANLNRNAAGQVSDIFDIGVTYKQSFGGTDIALGARWGTGNREAAASVVGLCGDGGSTSAINTPADATGCDNTLVARSGAVEEGDPETWGVSGTVSTAGFTFGASYAENDADNATSVGDTKGWGIGMSYDLAGPWSVGAQGYFGEEEQGANDYEYNTYTVSATRAMGPGVNWGLYAAYAENDDNDATTSEIKGSVIGTSISLNF